MHHPASTIFNAGPFLFHLYAHLRSPHCKDHCSNPLMTSYLILNKIQNPFRGIQGSQPPSFLCPGCTPLLPLCPISSLLFLKHIRVFQSQGLCTGYSPDSLPPPPPPAPPKKCMFPLCFQVLSYNFPTAWFCWLPTHGKIQILLWTLSSYKLAAVSCSLKVCTVHPSATHFSTTVCM